MKLPEQLKIGGHTYRVVVTPDVFDGADGLTDRKSNTIFINDKLPPSQQGVTLIHEILHAINNEMEHTLLDSLSEQLYQVLSDNKLINI